MGDFFKFLSQYLNFNQSLRKNRKRWIFLVKLNPPIVFEPIRKNIVKLFVDNPSQYFGARTSAEKRWICRVKPVPSIIFGQAQQVSCHVFTQSGSTKKKTLPERVSECIMLEIHDLSLEI